MTSGGSSFEQGEDFVAARLSFDIPTDGIASLREITQEVDRFRTSVEAASRGGSNFVNYLNQIAEAATRATTAQQNLSNSLDRQAELSGRQATGSSPDLNAPPQYSAPFSGMQAGTGEGRNIPTTTPTMPQVQGQLDELRANNPRAYVNKMAATGGLKQGDLAGGQASQVAETAERINARDAVTSGGTSAITKSVMSELGSGVGSAGARGAGTSLMEGLGAGGVGGRALAAMGPVGIALGAGAMAYGGVQEAGSIYQGYKNMGSVRGGGAAEGAGYEMNIRAMAMNPFISTEQARQIVQQGLKEGYTGKEFDTVTQFVAANLKGMNMDISQSFELMNKNVKEGGQSIESLNMALAGLKESSKTGYQSLPDLLKSYQQTSGALISSGTAGPAASATAASAAQVFAGSKTAAGTGGDLVQAFNSPTGQMYMREAGGLTMPPGSEGIIPQAQAFLMGPNAGLEGASNVIKKWALEIWNSRGKPPPPADDSETPSGAFAECLALWQMRLQQMGINWDAPKVRTWFVAYVKGQDPATEGEQKSAESNKAALVPHGKGAVQKSFDTVTTPVKTVMGGLVGAARAFGGAIADLSSDKWQGIGHYEDLGAKAAQPYLENPSDMQSGALSAVQGVYGAKGIQYLDASGKPISFDQSNAQQMAQLQSGEIKWKPKGTQGPGHTLAETASMSADDIKNMGGGGTARVSGELQITVSPEAQRAGIQAPPKVQLNPHEQQANSGYGNATPNNPAPGYEMPRSRYR